MSGPAAVEQVLARISQIQSCLACADDSVAGLIGPRAIGGSPAQPTAGSALGGTFASVLASTSAGGVVTSGGDASAWAIPWVAGAAPVATPAGTSAMAGLSRLAAAGGSAPGAVVWPVRGSITQGFGPSTCTLEPPATVNGTRYAHYHDGLDVGASEGTPVRSMASGTVEFAGRYPDGAEVVRVRHADGSVALYAHLQPDLAVRQGDTVAAGQRLGSVGMTGNTTGPHLHLELTVDGKAVDPLPVLDSGHLPGAVARAAVVAPPASGARASALAAADGQLTQAALDQFDAVGAQIPYHAEIRDAAVRAGVDPLLLASLVRAESGFRADAVSSAGAQGLCQLMPATASSMGVTDPLDAVQNLRAGARYLASDLRLYGRTDVALAAYHDGKGAVAAAGGVPDYPVTQRYIDRICSYWTTYREAAA